MKHSFKRVAARLYQHTSATFLLLLIFALTASQDVLAVDYTWTGLGGSGNWDNPNNWNPNTSASGPFIGDNAIFPTGFTINPLTSGATIQCSNVTVSGANVTFGVNAHFYGTVTISGGSLDMSTYSLQTNGLTTISGGTFTAGSGSHNMAGISLTSGTFNANTSTITFSGDFTISGGGSSTFNEATAIFNFSQANGYAVTSDRDISFNQIIHNTTATSGTRTLSFVGSGGTRNFTIKKSYERGGQTQGTGRTNANLLYAAAAQLIYTPSGAPMVVDPDEWPASSGPTDVTYSGSSNLTLSTARTISSSGTLKLNGASTTSFAVDGALLTIQGQLLRSNSTATFALTNGGSITYSGTSSKLTYDAVGTNTFTIGSEFATGTDAPYNLEIGGSDKIDGTALGSGLRVRGNVTLGSSAQVDLGSYEFTVLGDVSSDLQGAGGIIAANTTLVLGDNSTPANSTTAQTFSGQVTLSKLIVNKTGGGNEAANTVTLTDGTMNFRASGTLTVTNGSLVLNSNSIGATNIGTLTLTISSGGTIYTKGQSLTSIGTFSTASGKIVFNSPSAPEILPSKAAPTGLTIGTVEINNSYGVQTNSGLLIVNNLLTFTSGTITTSSSNSLRLSLSATVGGTPSGSLMVKGPLQKEFPSGAQSFTYPVGFGSSYRPAIFEFASNALSYKIIEVEAVQGDPGGTAPSGISLIATSHYYVVKQVDALGGPFTYHFTGIYTGTGFTEANNRLIVQNGASTYIYPHTIAQTVNTVAKTVKIEDALDASLFPTNDGKIAFGNGGTTKYWTGGAGTSNWADDANWNPSGAPGSTDDAVIQASSAPITVNITGSTTATANSLIIAGQSSTNTVILTVNGTAFLPFVIYSTSAGALTLNAYSTLKMNNSNGTGVKFTSGYGYYPDATDYRDNSTVEYVTPNIEADSYSNLVVSNTTGTRNLNGDVTVRSTFTKTGAGVFDFNTHTLDAQANVSLSGGSVSATGGGVLKFSGSGSSNQTFSSSITLPTDLITRIERGAGTGTVTLSGNVTSSGTLVMASGLLTTSSSNLLTVGGASSLLNTSYVDGPLAISGSGTKLFPIGKGGFFRPVKVTTADVGNLQFELFNSAPGGNKGTMNRISTVRYWQTNALGLVSGSSVGLGYGSDDGITNPTGPTTGVVIASASTKTGTYENNGRSSSGAESQLGGASIIQSSTLTTPTNQFFTFGTGDALPDNPLPVELSKFIATTDGKGVILNWTTASETNNQGFIVSRSESKDGPFQQISSYQANPSLKGQGTTSGETNYRMSDYSSTVQSGKTYYYRLEDVNLTGQRNLLGTREVKLPEGYSLSQNYPNPFNPSTTINFTLRQDGKTMLEVYNILGQRVATIVNSELKAGAYSYNWNAAGVTSGVYFYRLVSGSFVQTKKMLLVK